ncbi:MAG: hypothetical protein GXP62_19660 [Oligoflexia bacterium]|nr:hypothetical protein [Oligoflexia bacterium]
MKSEETARRSIADSKLVWALVMGMLALEGSVVIRHQRLLAAMNVQAPTGTTPTTSPSAVSSPAQVGQNKDINPTFVSNFIGIDAKDYVSTFITDHSVSDTSSDKIWASMGAYALRTNEIQGERKRGLISQKVEREHVDLERFERRRTMNTLLGQDLGLAFEQGLAPILDEDPPTSLPSGDAPAPKADATEQETEQP